PVAPLARRCFRGSRKEWRAMRRKAFTLIELLVVIAIIAIVTAILFPAALRESTSADSKLPGRGALHAIQFAALLVACCGGRDRASFRASRNNATIPGLALPHSSCCFFDNHDLDDVLSIAFAHCGIAGWSANGVVG